MGNNPVPYLVQMTEAVAAGDDMLARACLTRGMQDIGNQLNAVSNGMADIDRPLFVASLEMYAALGRAGLSPQQIQLVENIKNNISVMSVRIPIGTIPQQPE